MGMTIDKSIEVIISAKPERPTSMYGIMKKNAFNTAIDTMRKYQKIVDIVSLNAEEFKQCGLKELKEILEVIADGNDD